MAKENGWDKFFQEVAGSSIEQIQYENHPSYRVLLDYKLGKLPSGLRPPEEILDQLKKGKLVNWRESELRFHLMTCPKCSKRLKWLAIWVAIFQFLKKLGTPLSGIPKLFWLKDGIFLRRRAFYAHLGAYLVAFVIALLAIFNPSLFWTIPDSEKVQIHHYHYIVPKTPPDEGFWAPSPETKRETKRLSRDEFTLSKPKITQIRFPKIVIADGREAEGQIHFESPSRVVKVKARVIEPASLNIENLNFAPKVRTGQSPIKFGLLIDKPQDEVILSIYLINKQGLASSPAAIRFQAVAPPRIFWPVLIGPLALWGVLLFFHGKVVHRIKKDRPPDN